APPRLARRGAVQPVHGISLDPARKRERAAGARTGAAPLRSRDRGVAGTRPVPSVRDRRDGAQAAWASGDRARGDARRLPPAGLFAAHLRTAAPQRVRAAPAALSDAGSAALGGGGDHRRLSLLGAGVERAERGDPLLRAARSSRTGRTVGRTGRSGDAGGVEPRLRGALVAGRGFAYLLEVRPLR